MSRDTLWHKNFVSSLVVMITERREAWNVGLVRLGQPHPAMYFSKSRKYCNYRGQTATDQEFQTFFSLPQVWSSSSSSSWSWWALMLFHWGRISHWEEGSVLAKSWYIRMWSIALFIMRHAPSYERSCSKRSKGWASPYQASRQVMGCVKIELHVIKTCAWNAPTLKRSSQLFYALWQAM